MQLKILVDKQILPDLILKKDKKYEVVEIVLDTYKIKVPKKQKGKYQYVLVEEKEGELVD